jgi:hypothetical protein
MAAGDLAWQAGDKLILAAKADGQKMGREFGAWPSEDLAELVGCSHWEMSQSLQWFGYDHRNVHGRVWHCDHVGRGAVWALLTPAAWQTVSRRALVENTRRIIVVYNTKLVTLANLSPSKYGPLIAAERQKLAAMLAIAQTTFPAVQIPVLNGVVAHEDEDEE